MPKFQDLTGKTFGYLTAIKLLPKNKSGKNRWLCRCKCGKYATPTTHRLLSGFTVSCGCIRHEASHETYTHGKSNTRIYKIWCGIKKRCLNKNDSSYERYGALGISICNEWLHNFESFYEWSISNGYNDELTIDRIDNSKGYSPSNCRWATLDEQARNKRRTIYITNEGNTKPLSEWCLKYNYPYKKALQRYHMYKKRGSDNITIEMLFNPENLNCRKIKQYSLSGDIVHEWDSISDAGKSGYSKTGIHKCLSGQFRTSGGFQWKYAD